MLQTKNKKHITKQKTKNMSNTTAPKPGVNPGDREG
jgi:hypothetical protein